jgi:phosphate transport system substrate-binding protein
VDQINKIFNAKSASFKLSALNAKCASVEVKITGSDDKSGTTDFFKQTVFGKDSKDTFRASYFTTDSEDFNVVVKTVLSNGDYIGYTPFEYYTKNSATLSAAKIKSAAGKVVAPSTTTIANGSYTPFTRTVYMSVLNTSLAKVKDYLKYGLSAAGITILKAKGLVSLSSAALAATIKRLG